MIQHEAHAPPLSPVSLHGHLQVRTQFLSDEGLQGVRRRRHATRHSTSSPRDRPLLTAYTAIGLWA